MSRNALALVDCNNREQLFQFLAETFDRKATKNEMISPYDDQLIGKMNFHYRGVEHAMFFTYARSSEYPGMRFRNHRIIYLSLAVHEISSDIFNQICGRFGGFVNYDDELEVGWQKIERQKQEEELWLEETAAAAPQAEEAKQEQQGVRQILKLERSEEPRDGQEARRKDNRPDRRRHDKNERNRNDNRGQRNDRNERNDRNDRNDRNERNEKNERNERKDTGKHYNRSRTGQKKREPKAAGHSEKAGNNEKQA